MQSKPVVVKAYDKHDFRSTIILPAKYLMRHFDRLTLLKTTYYSICKPKYLHTMIFSSIFPHSFHTTTFGVSSFTIAVLRKWDDLLLEPTGRGANDPACFENAC